MSQTLLRNGYIVSMDANEIVYDGGSVLIEDQNIVAVGQIPTHLLSTDVETIELAGKYVLPGFINSHVHTSQQLGRGIADDVCLLTWLHDRIWPFESSLSEEDSYVSTLACCLELIRSGVTSFAEAGGQFVAAMARAVSEAGLRAKLAKSVLDSGVGLPSAWQRETEEELDSQVALYESLHGTAEGRIEVWFGLRTIFNCSDNLIVRTKELADHYKTGIHMHVAEVAEEIAFCRERFGASTVEHLAKLGVLDSNFLAVHSVWLSNDEVDLFCKHNVKVSHNPAAAMRVLGFAKVPQMLNKGICVSLGTDGAPCNNHMDIVDEMWLTSLIHKGWRLDPTVVSAEQILRMATRYGAQALLDENLYGALAPGMKADLIIIDPAGSSSEPTHDRIAALVTSLHSSNVVSSMCNGRWLMRDRCVLTLDEEAIMTEACQRAEAIRKRSGIKLPDRFLVQQVSG